MKTKYMNKMLNMGLGFALLLGGAACSDDHFDVVEGQASAAKTIWENIVDQPQLDSLRMILQRTPVLKSKTDNKSTVTYAEFLNRPQTITFWAPLDGAYNARHFLDLLDAADTMTVERNALAQRYLVGRQLVQNHLARFNYENTVGKQQVLLMNSKVADYDVAKSSFGNVPLLASAATIPSSNGTLHVLDGYHQFLKNIREFVTENYDSVSSIVNSYDVVEFDENNSIAGAMNSEGKMEYVDSIYSTTNRLLSDNGAQISNEDSVYIAIVPATSVAWTNITSKLAKLYKYGSSYTYGWQNNNGKADFVYSGENAAKFNTDSLTTYNSRLALFRNMYVSASDCGFEATKVDSATLINYVVNADSLKSTRGLIYYNANKGGANPMFEGLSPARASNGYVFELQNYDVDPTYAWVDKKEMNMSNGGIIAKTENAEYDNGELVQLDDDVKNDTIKFLDLIENKVYRRFEVYGRNNTLRVWIKLQGVLSTSYRLKMVMAPNYTRVIDTQYDTDGNILPVTSMFTADVFYDDHTSSKQHKVNSEQAVITVNQDSVREYVIFDTLTFDKCYQDLPSSVSGSFPYLQLELNPQYQNRRGKNNNALNVVKVILEPIHEDEE